MKGSESCPTLWSERVVNDNHRISHSHKNSSREVPSHLSEQCNNDNPRISRSNKKSSRDDVLSLKSKRGTSDDYVISSSINSSEDIADKTIESEVPSNFELCHESNLKKLKNQRFPFNCQACGFSAKYRTQLVAHMKTHNAQNTKISKRYRCTICTFSSLMKSHLERHVKGHEKPLKCKNCNFRASLNISMKKHEDACLRGSVSGDVDNVSDKDLELPDIFKPAKESLQKKSSLTVSGNAKHLGVVSTAPCEDDDELPDISTLAKESPANKPFETKDYFQCAFCSYKASSETLLTSHVNSTH